MASRALTKKMEPKILINIMRSEPLILYLLQKASDLVSAFMCKKIADLQFCNLLFITGYLDSPIAVHDGLMI